MCLHAYSIKECGARTPNLYPWVSSSGVLGMWRNVIIASKRLGLKKKIETLILAPGLCVGTKWA